MDISEFEKVYNPERKCYTYYMDQHGFTISGLVLDSPSVSTFGVPFVYVDSFSNRVRVSDILYVKVSDERWIR